MAIRPRPECFHRITPYLTVKRAAELIEFLKLAFDAKECHRHSGTDGSVGHAQDSMLMLSEATVDIPSSIYLYVEDTDATYNQAVKSAGISLMEPADQHYGDRNAGVKDLLGNLATHTEDVSPEEMTKCKMTLFTKA